MRCVLGTDVEALTFTENGIEAVPTGLAHAVDLSSPMNRSAGTFAYAVCGHAVRAWPDREFNPSATDAHDECASRALAGPEPD